MSLFKEYLEGHNSDNRTMTIHIPDWLDDNDMPSLTLSKYKLKLATKMKRNGNGNWEFDIKGKRSDLQNWIDDYYQTGDPDSDNPEFYEKVKGEKMKGGAAKIITAYKNSSKSSKIKGHESSENYVIFNTTLPQKVYHDRYALQYGKTDTKDLRLKMAKKENSLLSFKISKRRDGLYEVRKSNYGTGVVEYQALLQLKGKNKFDTADEAVDLMLFYIKKAS